MSMAIVRAVISWATACVDAWDRFWFTPTTADTLALLRIGTGGMLLYSHLVLAMDLPTFLGDAALIDNATSRSLQDGTLGPAAAVWSSLWWLDSPVAYWTHHAFTIAVTLCMTIGLATRITVPIAVVMQWMLIHRLLGALFGLDQIVTYAAMYLAITPCGAVWSVDAWIRDRPSGGASDASAASDASGGGRGGWLPADVPSVSANLGTRLLQLHLCAIYLFGGLAKARGEMWWDGTALWFAISNAEYQSIDVTFLSAYPRVFTGLTHVTLFWEVFYVALVWPRLTRPVTLAMAVAVHAGIAVFLGMITFGTMMIIANGIFVAPSILRRWRLGQRADEDDANANDEAVLTQLALAENSPIGGSAASIDHRLAEVSRAEAAIKKRYLKLKRREQKLTREREIIDEVKAKLRQKLADGSRSSGRDSAADLLDDEANR